MRTCVELGHALGNQHWPALVKGTRVFVPLTVDRKVMASVMNTHRFEGIRYEFVPGDDIVPYLAPHESRRLFGGAEGPVHTHTHDRYVAVDAETGRACTAAPPVRAAHPHADNETAMNDAARRRRRAARARGAPRAACCSSATRCSRSAASPSPAGSNPRSRSASSPTRITLLAYARTAVEQAARGDGIGLVCAHRAGGSGRLGGARADRRADLRAEALGRDAHDVRAHGQEVRRDGRPA